MSENRRYFVAMKTGQNQDNLHNAVLSNNEMRDERSVAQRPTNPTAYNELIAKGFPRLF
jgi:hypothetical protein